MFIANIKDWRRLRKARKWCNEAHGDQGYGNTKKDDGGMDGHHPYSFHLDKVEEVAVRFGFRYNFGVRIGCRMHDVFEDTAKKRRDAFMAGFSYYAVSLAWACTDGVAPTRHERKLIAYAKIVETPDAIIVKLADRIANVEHAVCVGYHRKVELYRGEMAEFEEHLRHAPVSNPAYQVRVDAMWSYLNWLFSDDARTQLWGSLHCCVQPAA